MSHKSPWVMTWSVLASSMNQETTVKNTSVRSIDILVFVVHIVKLYITIKNYNSTIQLQLSNSIGVLDCRFGKMIYWALFDKFQKKLFSALCLLFRKKWVTQNCLKHKNFLSELSSNFASSWGKDWFLPFLKVQSKPPSSHLYAMLCQNIYTQTNQFSQTTILKKKFLDIDWGRKWLQILNHYLKPFVIKKLSLLHAFFISNGFFGSRSNVA